MQVEQQVSQKGVSIHTIQRCAPTQKETIINNNNSYISSSQQSYGVGSMIVLFMERNLKLSEPHSY